MQVFAEWAVVYLERESLFVLLPIGGCQLVNDLRLTNGFGSVAYRQAQPYCDKHLQDPQEAHSTTSSESPAMMRLGSLIC